VLAVVEDHDGGRIEEPRWGLVRTAVVCGRGGGERELHARLMVGADGRGSRVPELAGISAKTRPPGRIAYFAEPGGIHARVRV
jgi:2-polyprenyl-6-methoxyphenol hydroxylase-like FAD-dependent oxidoreductase